MALMTTVMGLATAVVVPLLAVAAPTVGIIGIIKMIQGIGMLGVIPQAV